MFEECAMRREEAIRYPARALRALAHQARSARRAHSLVA
jgi:hypothetical protein